MECMSFNEEFKFASIPRNLLATCDQSLPRPEWEPAMHLILVIGMIVLVPVSILTAYMEAMLYLRSQQASVAQSNGSHSITQSSNHHNGGSNKDYCSNHLTDSCNKDRSNGSGHGAAAISASNSSYQSSLPFNALSTHANGSVKNNNKSNNNNNIGNNKANNNCTQKRRKNSSTANSEKVPTSNKSIGSTTSDKKSSSPYAPIFQNLTNVISSPPPPLPTFDSEFDSLEFKKLRGKKSAKKSNSLNGSIASSDDIGNPNTLNQGHVTSSNQVSSKAKQNGKSAGLKIGGSNSIDGVRDVDLRTESEQTGSRESSINREGSLKDVFTAASLADEESYRDKINKLYNGVKKANEIDQQEQTTMMPIQPPSSLSSTPSSCSSTSSSSSASSSSSSTSSSSSASPSSTSSSPPLSASSYGEYSLLGPGATFELPCLRVRSRD